MPHNLGCSQVLGIGAWTNLRHHCSAFHPYLIDIFHQVHVSNLLLIFICEILCFLPLSLRRPSVPRLVAGGTEHKSPEQTVRPGFKSAHLSSNFSPKETGYSFSPVPLSWLLGPVAHVMHCTIPGLWSHLRLCDLRSGVGSSLQACGPWLCF